MSKSYSDAIEKIKARANIVDVIGSLVTLKRAGNTYKACCPFHNEKTPSFVVWEQSQQYVCFGCGEKGDLIKFVQKYYNITFPEAVERLATQYGITIEDSYGEENAKKDGYYELNRQAARFFYDAFTTKANPGFSYMKKRGIEPKTLQAFGIGYADDQWQSLTEFMKSKGAEESMLAELSLLSEKNGRYYDRFRGRVMFPIFNTRDKVIGFGGRIIGDGEPKYLNSSESLIFRKGYNLYGLNITKGYIQKDNLAIVVEGYMDVVSLYQSGVCNVVASLGTALTLDQAKLLKRYCSQVVLCYDADNAGINAALRGIDVLRQAGLDVKVLHVDDGKDPDEYIKRHGRDEFLALVRNKAVADVDYKISLLRRKYDLNSTTEGIRFLQAAASVLRELRPVEQDLYIRKVASDYRISEGSLRREVEGGKSPTPQTENKVSARQTQDEAPSEESIAPASLMMERTLIRLCLLNSDYFRKLSDYPEAFVSRSGRRVASAMEALLKPSTDFDISDLRDVLEEEPYRYLEDILENVVPGENDGAMFAECKEKLDSARRRTRIADIQKILELGESEGQEYDMTSLMRELMDLQKQEKK